MRLTLRGPICSLTSAENIFSRASAGIGASAYPRSESDAFLLAMVSNYFNAVISENNARYADGARQLLEVALSAALKWHGLGDRSQVPRQSRTLQGPSIPKHIDHAVPVIRSAITC